MLSLRSFQYLTVLAALKSFSERLCLARTTLFASIMGVIALSLVSHQSLVYKGFFLKTANSYFLDGFTKMAKFLNCGVVWLIYRRLSKRQCKVLKIPGALRRKGFPICLLRKVLLRCSLTQKDNIRQNTNVKFIRYQFWCTRCAFR
jgi:hypothetical protein